MADLLLIVSIAMGLYLAWNIGVSTFGSTIGITFGSTKIPRQTAAIFSSIAAILGIALLSNRVVDTISKDLIKLDLNGLFSVLIAIAVIATIVVYRGIPISTTYVVVGAISGHALIKSAAVNFATLEKVAISMFLSPFGALAIGFVIFYIMRTMMVQKNSGMRKIESFEMKFFVPGFIALLLLTFGLGANSVGVVIGLLGGKVSFPTLILIGSAGLIIGVLSWSSKTAHRLGTELVDLSPSRGFVAMLSAGLVMLAFVLTGIPVSTTQTLIGATVGVGLARKNMDIKKAFEVSLSWLIILPAALTIVSMLLAALVGFVL